MIVQLRDVVEALTFRHGYVDDPAGRTAPGAVHRPLGRRLAHNGAHRLRRLPMMIPDVLNDARGGLFRDLDGEVQVRLVVLFVVVRAAHGRDGGPGGRVVAE